MLRRPVVGRVRPVRRALLDCADSAAARRQAGMSLDYAALKLVHQSAVALSVTGFFVRGLASFSGAGWVRSRAARTLPHAVDTVLLLSALAMAWMLRLTPGNAPWLLAKIVGLVLYVGLGVVALRPGRSLAVRAAAWTAA